MTNVFHKIYKKITRKCKKIKNLSKRKKNEWTQNYWLELDLHVLPTTKQVVDMHWLLVHVHMMGF